MIPSYCYLGCMTGIKHMVWRIKFGIEDLFDPLERLMLLAEAVDLLQC